MDKLAAVFLVFAVNVLAGSASRVRIIRHTVPVVHHQPHLHLNPKNYLHLTPKNYLHLTPKNYQSDQSEQSEVYHHPHSAHDQATGRYADSGNHYVGSSTARQTGQTQLFNQLAGDHGNVAGAQSKDHKEHSGRDGVLHSLQQLDDGYNRDSGFHNVYSKVEFGRTGEFGNHGGKNQQHSNHGQHNTYTHGRNVADANAHGHVSGNLGTYADYQQQHRTDGQLQHRMVPSTPRPYTRGKR